ncbi:MAG: hypothetical protein KBC21_04260 [Candidatus Pacebacteria bacterium]|nr:hypothetical protein [Candidatus Paceibacterota bacterium]
MKNTEITLTLDGTGRDGQPEMTRNKWRRIVKTGFLERIISLEHNWCPNIIHVFSEIAKNIYDHGGKKGTLKLKITYSKEMSEVEAEGFDYGPGYQGSSRDVSFDTLRRVHFGKSTKPMTQGGNAGLGLEMIKGGLDGLKKVEGVTHASHEVTTQPHFHYRIRILFTK